MLNLKKTAVAVLAFGSSAVFAGTMGPVCTPGNVTVPCERSAWDFAGQALYLEPSYSGHDFYGSTISNAAYNTAGGTRTYNNMDKWGWGFKLEGSYHYNTGNDIDLNWYHWNRSTTVTPNTVLFSEFAGLDTFATGLSLALKPQWDAVNLEFGQHVDFSPMSNVRVHAGLEYARIKSSVTASTTGATGTDVITSLSSNTTYNGVGPRVGADLGYGWDNGLSVYGNGGLALLAGTSKFTVTEIENSVTFVATGSSTVVVPELEAKLGAMYTYAMAQGDLSLDVGWMWVNYFNSQNLGSHHGGHTRQSDFAVQGPFIGLKWIGNVV